MRIESGELRVMISLIAHLDYSSQSIIIAYNTYNNSQFSTLKKTSITCSADSIPALSAQTPGCRVSRAFVRVLGG